MDTMYSDGALIRISLDGLMAANITAGDLVNVGDAVVVVLSDEAEIDGKISAVSDGTATVTLDDTTAGDGEVVTIKTADGDALGEARLIYTQ